MKKSFFKILKFSVVPFVVLCLFSCGGSQVAIEVGETQIERNELIDWSGKRTGIENPDTLTLLQTADEWIQNQALVDFLNEYGVEVEKEEIDRARNQLLASGLTDSDPRLDMYSEWQAFRNIAAQGGPAVQLAYERNKNLLGHELCTSHILTNTRQEAVEVIKLLDSGQSFEDLALTFSTDPGSGSQGGYLGCVPLGAFVPSFERAVLGGLKVSKELLDPVGSQFGFHVIRIDKRSPIEPMLFEEQDERIFMSMMHLATLTREIELDPRYGTWDPVIGQIVPVQVSESP